MWLAEGTSEGELLSTFTGDQRKISVPLSL